MQAVTELNPEAPATLRYGYVSAVDKPKSLARVRFPDKDNLVSWWLPIMYTNGKGSKENIDLDIGEHVVCIMAGNGLEMGTIIGRIK